MTTEPEQLRMVGPEKQRPRPHPEYGTPGSRGAIFPAAGAIPRNPDAGLDTLRFPDSRRAESFAYQAVKRCLDIALAALLGLAALPLVVMVAAYVVADSGRPVFFWQNRVGRYGRRFRLLKLRTLPKDVLEWPEETWFVQPDSRVMEIVRRTGMDELPQLWNVIRGEMSLVGPRPERPVFAEGFQARLPLYGLRHQLRPGLTGWAQIHGWRGDTSIGRRLEHDLEYLENWSLGLDAKILARTAVMALQDLLRRPASK